MQNMTFQSVQVLIRAQFHRAAYMVSTFLCLLWQTNLLRCKRISQASKKNILRFYHGFAL